MSVKQTRQALICTIFVSFRFVARRIMRRKVCHKMQSRQAGRQRVGQQLPQLPQQLQLNWESSRCRHPLAAPLLYALPRLFAVSWQTNCRLAARQACRMGKRGDGVSAWRLNASRADSAEFQIYSNQLVEQSVSGRGSAQCVCECVCVSAKQWATEWMIQLGIKYLQQTFKYCDRLDTPSP